MDPLESDEDEPEYHERKATELFALASQMFRAGQELQAMARERRARAHQLGWRRRNRRLEEMRKRGS